MFGLDPKARAARMEERIAVLRACLERRTVRIRGPQGPGHAPPRPAASSAAVPRWLDGSLQRGAQPASASGSTPTCPSCTRPTPKAAALQGFTPNPMLSYGPTFMHVTHDPDGDWAHIAPHALHETNEYGKWANQAQVDSSYEPVTSERELRARGTYAVVTPAEAVALARRLGSCGVLLFHPLMAGLDPDLSWNSLRLFAAEVLPHLSIDKPTPEPV